MLSPRLFGAAFAAFLASVSSGQSPVEAIVREGAVVSTQPTDVALPRLDPSRLYSVTAKLPSVPTDGAMATVELFDPSGMPTGKTLHAGDPDMHFVFRPRIDGDTVLRVRRAESVVPVVKAIEDATRAVARDRDVVALMQDDARLATALTEGDGDARLVDEGAWSGASALRVDARMRIARNVPGWGFRIAEKPQPGEYRYLRFAWRVEKGDTAMLALADQGELGDPADGRLRYVVGPQLAEWGATKVADVAPSEWTVVTRDLWADRGAFMLTGMALLPCGGAMWIDHCYLGRTLADLDAVTPASVREALRSGSADGLQAIRQAGPPVVRGPFRSFDVSLPWRVEIRPLDVVGAEAQRLESEPNDQWNYADEFRLGQVVHGGADDIEYLDNEHEGRIGWDWFRFTWNEDAPKLVYFTLDCPDRDVPATMRLYVRDEVGRLVPYTRGKDPTEVRHDNQDASIAGWKFLTRVVAKGTYWLHVKANHPNYTLRTQVFDPPPYDDPRKAVRIAAEYLAQAGDSFFANVPRGGAVRRRVEANTDETTRCFACHAGHYPVIANLAAHKNGYRVVESVPFRNLVDRVYEVGVPLYGHEEATWARFDLAPTVGIARVGTMMCEFEDSVSGRRTDAIVGPARFAELVYGARTELPRRGDRTEAGNFEFDGNRPIPDARVATEAWRLFDTLADRTGKAEWRALAEHMSDLVATARVKDNEDLVEQSLGMTAMDPVRHAKAIRANMEQLLSRIHDDGGWVTAEYLTNLQVNELQAMAALDQPQAPSLTFFTAMAAYALLQTGMPEDGAERARLLDRVTKLLLSRQLEFGGWIDPQGELFRTPYLETHWAVIFLARMFPEDVAAAQPKGEARSGSPAQEQDAVAGRVATAGGAPSVAGSGSTAAQSADVGAGDSSVTQSPAAARSGATAVQSADVGAGDPTEAQSPTAARAGSIAAQSADVGASDPTVTQSPAAARAGSTVARLDWLSAQWKFASREQLDAVLAMLADGEPLMRSGAAHALQRMSWRSPRSSEFAGAISPLAKALGDADKSVARAAAVALRALGHDPKAAEAVVAALASPDARARRGAMRVFAHRFSELASNVAAREAVLARIDDPDHVVRIAAAQAAQRWWYRAKAADKPAILGRLLARARVEGESPVVLGAIEKALYDICDENTAELYGNDARVMATDAHREAMRKARDEVVERDLAEQLAATLRTGPREARLVVLRALGRRIANGLANGNDTDDVTMMGPQGAVLAEQILLALRDEDEGVREAAAWASTSVRRHAGPAFVAALLDAAGDRAPRVRNAALRGIDVVEVRGQDLPANGVVLRFLADDQLADESAQDRTRGVLRWLRRDPSSQRLEFVPELVRILGKPVETSFHNSFLIMFIALSNASS